MIVTDVFGYRLRTTTHPGLRAGGFALLFSGAFYRNVRRLYGSSGLWEGELVAAVGRTPAGTVCRFVPAGVAAAWEPRLGKLPVDESAETVVGI